MQPAQVDGSLSRREQPAGRQPGDSQAAPLAPPHAASPAIPIPTPAASSRAALTGGAAPWDAPQQPADPADRGSPQPHSQPRSFRSALERVSANLTPVLGPHPAWGLPVPPHPPTQMPQLPEPAVLHQGLQEGSVPVPASAESAQPGPHQPVPAAETTAQGSSQLLQPRARRRPPPQQSQAAVLTPQTQQTPPRGGQVANSRAGNLQSLSHAPQGAESAPSSSAAAPAAGLPASCPEAAPPRQINAPAQQPWPHMQSSSQPPRQDLPWDPAGDSRQPPRDISWEAAGGSQQLPGTRQPPWDQGETSQEPQADRQARPDQPRGAEDPAELQFREAWRIPRGNPRGSQGQLSSSAPGFPGGEAVRKVEGDQTGLR